MSLQQKGRMVSSKVLQTILSNTTKGGPVASLVQKGISKVSKEVLGYDFFGLITKLVVIYVIAYLVKTYFAALILGNTTLNLLLTPLGIKLNAPLPAQVVNFFKNGFLINIGKPDPNLGQLKLSLSYWDFVNVLVFSVVLAEAIRNYEDNKKLGGRFSYVTIAAWGIIVSALGLITFSNIIARYQAAQKILSLEAQAIQQQNQGDTSAALATLQAAVALIAANADLVQVPITTGPQVSQ